MKNQKGITLIALVITIIVLLILAGITIAMLTGQNGLLSNANKAKVTDIEASVQEQVNLGAAAIRLEIATEAAKDPSWDATTSGHLSSLATTLDNDLTATSGKDAWTVTPGSSQLTVVYSYADYDNATNSASGAASITYILPVTQQGISVTTPPTFVPAHTNN